MKHVKLEKNTSASSSVQRYPNVTACSVVMYSSVCPVMWTAAALIRQMEDHRPLKLSKQGSYSFCPTGDDQD